MQREGLFEAVDGAVETPLQQDSGVPRTKLALHSLTWHPVPLSVEIAALVRAFEALHPSIQGSVLSSYWLPRSCQQMEENR